MRMLHIERVFDAPRELVWKAFTDPDEFTRWFGPVGYSVPRDTCDFDIRVGGHQRFTMVADDPADPPGGPADGMIRKVVENELLVGTEELDEESTEIFGTSQLDLRLEFRDEGEGRTRLVLDQGPYNDDFEGNAREGWGSSFTKLDALLAG